MSPETEIALEDKKSELSVCFFDDGTIEDVEAFEDMLVDSGMDEAEKYNEKGMNDRFCNGMYCRSLFIPKDTFLTGAIHRRPYIDICAYGDITVKSYLVDGSVEKAERIKGFRFLDGIPGRKRVGYAHEDTLWIIIDPTKKEAMEEAKKDIVFLKKAEFIDFNKGIEA